MSIPLLVMLFTIIGCGQRNASEGVQLVYWSSTNPDEIRLAEKLTAEWNLAHPDTQVVLQPLPEGRSGEEVLIVSAAGRTTPDICSNVPPAIVPVLAKAGTLVPVDSFPGGREFMEQRMPKGMVKKFLHSDSLLYQIPWKGNPIMVQYNTKLLRDAGVTKIPTTWDEWNDVADKVTRDTDGDGRNDKWMATVQVDSEWRRRLFDFYTFYIAASDGKTLLEGGKVDFENSTAVRVVSFFRWGFQQGWYPKMIHTGDMFIQGHFASVITGPWNIAHVDRLMPEGFEYTFGPIPVPEGHEGPVHTFGDPKSIGIFTTSKHPEAAWNFVKFMISRSGDLELLEETKQLPLRRNLLSDSLYSDFFERNPLMSVFAAEVPFTAGYDQNTALQEVFDTINDAFDEAAINDVKTPERALHDAAVRSKLILQARGS